MMTLHKSLTLAPLRNYYMIVGDRIIGMTGDGYESRRSALAAAREACGKRSGVRISPVR